MIPEQPSRRPQGECGHPARANPLDFGSCLQITRIPLLLLACFAAVTAAAQEPPNAAASGTSPSPGHATIKTAFRWSSFRLDDARFDQQRDGRDAIISTAFSVGLVPDLTLTVSAPVLFRDERFDFGDRDEDDDGVGDATVLLKYRIWRNDSNPLDTQRLSIVVGSDIRTGDDPFTSDGYNPILGLAYTQIAGRHGVNLAALWRFTTGGVAGPTVMPGQTDADLLTLDFAYLYRLYPVEYASDTPGALYGVIELNGVYETNNDSQLFLSPGLMWEAQTYVIEASIQIPVWQDLDNRARSDFVLMTGVRFSL